MMNDEVSFVLEHFQPLPKVPTRTGVVESKPKTKTRGFSSIQYVENSLRVSYLSNTVHLLEFDVSCRIPHLVSYVRGDHLTKWTQSLDNLCADLSSCTTDKSASLFAVVSRLLLSLNNLQPVLESTDNEKNAMLRSIFSCSTPSCRRIWDLELLLMRCSAIGRQSATFCTPVPDEFRGDGLLAERVLAVTESINTRELFSSSDGSLHYQQVELLGFLFSLRWEQATLRTISRTGTRSNERIVLCLDMQSAIGVESPKFAHLAKRHGVTTAFHGTKIGSVWSILNCGLRSMSETKYCKNGALMGSGVYFSSSYKAASFFAANDAAAGSFLTAWRHWSLLSLLNLSSDVLDGYSISCFPVFEAQIILPPHGNSTEKDCTRRDGNYFVVPNSQDIRITKLHLSFELVKKRSFSPLLIAVFIILGVIYLL